MNVPVDVPASSCHVPVYPSCPHRCPCCPPPTYACVPPWVSPHCCPCVSPQCLCSPVAAYRYPQVPLFSPRTMPVTLELRLLLLALALRGEAVSPSVSPAASPPESPSETCGAALADVLRRLRELEGHVQALRGHCGDTGGPQAGTGNRGQGGGTRGSPRLGQGNSGRAGGHGGTWGS